MVKEHTKTCRGACASCLFSIKIIHDALIEVSKCHQVTKPRWDFPHKVCTIETKDESEHKDRAHNTTNGDYVGSKL